MFCIQTWRRVCNVLVNNPLDLIFAQYIKHERWIFKMTAIKDLVIVFTAFDPVMVSISKSILEGAGIWYYAEGDRLQNMPFSYLSGPVKVWVRANDAEVAAELLSELG